MSIIKVRYCIDGKKEVLEAPNTLFRVLGWKPDVTIDGVGSNIKEWVKTLDTTIEEFQFLDDKKLLVISSECTVAPAITAYISEKIKQQPRIIWVDAHADINEPNTSLTGYLGGMPLGMITHRFTTPFWKGSTHSIVSSSNIAYYGLRRIDPSEEEFIAKEGIFKTGKILELIEWMKTNEVPIYLHIDLDVIDPNIMPAVSYPVSGGIEESELNELINTLDFGLISAVSICSYNDKNDNTSAKGTIVAKKLCELIQSKLQA